MIAQLARLCLSSGIDFDSARVGTRFSVAAKARPFRSNQHRFLARLTELKLVELGERRSWQTLQHRNDLRLDLIRHLPSVVDTRANLLNSWLEHIEWIADGKLNHDDQKKIDGWESQLVQAEVEFFKSESFEDVLIPTEAAFDSRDVRKTVNELDQTCTQFENLGQKASGTYNQSESLT